MSVSLDIPGCCHFAIPLTLRIAGDSWHWKELDLGYNKRVASCLKFGPCLPGATCSGARWGKRFEVRPGIKRSNFTPVLHPKSFQKSTEVSRTGDRAKAPGANEFEGKFRPVLFLTNSTMVADLTPKFHQHVCGEGWMPVSPGSWLVAKVSRAHLKCRPSHCAVPRTFHPNSALVLLGDLGSREAVAGGKLPVV